MKRLVLILSSICLLNVFTFAQGGVQTIPPSGMKGNNEPITITNFNNATTGKYLVKLNFFTNTYNTRASLTAKVDLDAGTITANQYSHFASQKTDDVLNGNGTASLTTQSQAYCQFKVYLSGKTLYAMQLMNPGGNAAKLKLEASTWEGSVVNGQTVSYVAYTGSDSGTFKQTGPKQWAEYTMDSPNVHATFTETHRDEWSVYLTKSDGARLQLDLHTKQVKFNGNFLFHISEAKSTVAEPTVPEPVTPAPTPNGPEGAVTFINDPDKQEIVIIEKMVSGQSTPVYAGQLYPDPAGRSVTLPAKINDRFVFRVEGQSDYKIPSYLVRQTGQRHTLKIGIRYKDSRNPYARIPNAEASRHSFDIFYVSPEAIGSKRDDAGGMMRQVFEDLKDDDVDWRPYDGDFALKDQFSLAVVDEGGGSSKQETRYGMSSFKEAFSFNIGLSAGIPGVGSLARSLGLDTSNEQKLEQKSVYTFARKDQKVYDINLVKEKAVLHADFKNAVRSLPVPSAVMQDVNQAKRDPTYAAYENFIRNWGTHYPTQVSYGGFMLAYKVYSMEQMLEAESLGISYSEKVEAELKGLEVGRSTDVSRNTSEQFARMNSSHITGYIYKGGQGDDNSWSVGDRVQPIAIKLERLHQLLDKMYFNDSDGLSDSDLRKKQKMLEMALAIYIGAHADNGTSLQPKVFKIRVKDIQNVGEESRQKLYGVMEISRYEGDEYKQGAVFFKRTENTYLSINKNQSVPFDASISYVVYPEGGHFNLAPHRFKIYTNLYDQYNSDSDATYGSANKYINFSDIPSDHTPLSVQLISKTEAYANRKEIRVNAEVRQVSLSGYGFPDE